MKCFFVLRNDWLTYSHGIAKYAYDNTEGRCVYHQLTKYLLDKEDGRRSTEFIPFLSGGKHRTSEETLFAFFREFVILNSLWENGEQ